VRSLPLLGAALALLAGCSQRPTLLSTYDHRWVGTVIAQDGSLCGAPTRGVMTLRDSDRLIFFLPNDGALVLRGSLAADGTIQAVRDAPGADHKPFTMLMIGQITRNGVIGTYTTPRCRWTVSLHPANH
jgi:hypothetical protein